MVLEIFHKDNQFRVCGQGLSTDWILDTPANRKSTIVFLRHLQDSNGKAIFSYQQLACIVESENRQAAHEHVIAFEACGGDFLSFLTRKRKVDAQVVEAVGEELIKDPLAEMGQLKQRVRQGGFDKDLSDANISAAMEQISVKEIPRP